MSIRTSSTLLALAALLASALTPTVALAHERRDVGKHQFVVGFIAEPALQGEPNGIDLRVTDKATNQPVVNAEHTLKAAIAYGGGQPREFSLRARFNMPGAYTADVIPTRPGTYLFTFTGTIDGQQVNERFESGPGRFNDVTPRTELMFPVAEASVAELQQALSEARQQASTATTIAGAGVVMGLVALGLAGYLAATRRSGGAARARA